MKKNFLRTLIKNLKFRVTDLFLFSNAEKLHALSLPSQYSLKIFDTNKKTGFKVIDNRKANNNICYAVFDGEKFVHTSWIFKKKFVSRQLGYKQAFTIGPCETIESYQGKGIYPAVLSAIQKDYADAQLIMFAKVSNDPSTNGIMKAGFQKTSRFKMVKLLGFKFPIMNKHL